MKSMPPAAIVNDVEDEENVQIPVMANVTAFLQLILVPAFILLALAAAGCLYMVIE